MVEERCSSWRKGERERFRGASGPGYPGGFKIAELEA